jgi:nucleotide-binding universal stress UspA family protein
VTLLRAGFGTTDVRGGMLAQRQLVAERTGAPAGDSRAARQRRERDRREARKLPISLIVMGSRMLTGIRALGSVSERVGRIAPCSVLVLRWPER